MLYHDLFLHENKKMLWLWIGSNMLKGAQKLKTQALPSLIIITAKRVRWPMCSCHLSTQLLLFSFLWSGQTRNEISYLWYSCSSLTWNFYCGGRILQNSRPFLRTRAVYQTRAHDFGILCQAPFREVLKGYLIAWNYTVVFRANKTPKIIVCASPLQTHVTAERE